MDEKQMLLMAAKAAGKHTNMWVEPGELVKGKGGWVQHIGFGSAAIWNPLTDDGDALRLAVKLCIGIVHNDPRSNNPYVLADGATFVGGVFQSASATEDLAGESERLAATRLAIVRAAAAIGEQSNG